MSTCTNASQCLDDHPFVLERACRCFQNSQENLSEEHLTKAKENRWKVWFTCILYPILKIQSINCVCLYSFLTSICILRCTLKWESRVRKMARESSNTSGTEETPFLDSATHKYCLIAFTNISCVRNTGPAPWSTDSSNWSETTLERSSWDLKVGKHHHHLKKKIIL